MRQTPHLWLTFFEDKNPPTYMPMGKCNHNKEIISDDIS